MDKKPVGWRGERKRHSEAAKKGKRRQDRLKSKMLENAVPGGPHPGWRTPWHSEPVKLQQMDDAREVLHMLYASKESPQKEVENEVEMALEEMEELALTDDTAIRGEYLHRVSQAKQHVQAAMFHEDRKERKEELGRIGIELSQLYDTVNE